MLSPSRRPRTATTPLPSSPRLPSSSPLRQQHSASTSRTTAPTTTTTASSSSQNCPCPACSNNRSVQHALNLRLAADAEDPLIRSPLLTDSALQEYNLYYSDILNHNATVHASVIEGYHNNSITKELATYYNTSAFKARITNEAVFRSFFRDHGDAGRAVGEMTRLLKPMGRTVEEHVGRIGGRWNGELMSNGDFMSLKAREFRGGHQSVSRPGTPTGGATMSPTAAAASAAIAAQRERDNTGRTNMKENIRSDQNTSITVPDSTTPKNKKRKYSTTLSRRPSFTNTTSTSPGASQTHYNTTRKPSLSKRHKSSHNFTPTSPTAPLLLSSSPLLQPSYQRRRPSYIRIPSPNPAPFGTINPRTSTLLSKSTQRGEGQREYIDEGGENGLGISPFMGIRKCIEEEEEIMFRVITSDDIRGILMGRSRNYGNNDHERGKMKKKGMGGDIWGHDGGGAGSLWKVGKVGVGGVGWY